MSAVEGYVRGDLGLDEATQQIVGLLDAQSGFGCNIPLESISTEESRRVGELTQAVLRKQAQRWTLQ